MEMPNGKVKLPKMKTKRNYPMIDKVVLNLSREFLKSKLSAAGVSYVVTSKSKYRRGAWIFILIATATFTGYMTYRVVSEYLRYPKFMLTEVKLPKMKRKRNYPMIDKVLLSLSREFLKSKLSAAGVSYVVTSKSKYRRGAWIFILIATATFTGYMTYRVVSEYLRYPKFMLTEVKLPKMKRKRNYPMIDKVLLSLSREFLKSKLSAAGVSYVVTSKSKYRRGAWILILIATATFMGYMTYKVISEYLKYPKIVLKEDLVFPRLTFPAVTVCSLTPLSKKFIGETSVKSIKKLRDFLETVEIARKDPEERAACARNPMCRWSWFNERCVCTDTTCETEFCLDEENNSCPCAPMMCNSSYNYLRKVCKMDRDHCVCETHIPYSRSGGTVGFSQNSKNIHNVLEMIKDEELKDIIQLIAESKVHDLTDVEDDLLPSSDDIYHYGTLFQDTITACSFEGKKCSKENFTVYFHAKFGKCYMFNYVGPKGTTSERARSIYNSGKTSGLNLILNLNASEIVDLLTREVGIRICVHDPRELPPISEQGFNIQTPDFTSVEVSLSHTKRLGPPWGSCVNEASDLPFPFEYKPYNQVICKKVCRRYYVRQICNCTKRSFLMGKVVVGGSFEPSSSFCKARNKTQMNCVNNVLRAVETKTIDCRCHPACKNKQYRVSMSSSRINTDFFKMVKGVRTLRMEDGKFKNFDLGNSSFMLGLKVYYRTLQVESFKEVPSYSWETLIANIGGNLGFFMGLSIVTFVEVCEFLWDVMLSLVCRNRVRPRPATADDPEFSQTRDFGRTCECSRLLEGKIREVDFKLRELFHIATRTYLSNEQGLVLPERRNSRRWSGIRHTSSNRRKLLKRGNIMASTSDALVPSYRDYGLRNFLMETADQIIDENRYPREKYGY